MKACVRSRGIAPLILNLGTRWRYVVNFTFQSLYFRCKNPDSHWMRSCVDPRDGTNVLEKRRALASATDQITNPRLSIPWPIHYTDSSVVANVHNNHALVGTRNPESSIILVKDSAPWNMRLQKSVQITATATKLYLCIKGHKSRTNPKVRTAAMLPTFITTDINPKIRPRLYFSRRKQNVS